ncbi:aldo/keto reductase [Alteromonas pelagimontana]|uniref:Aldo/keto reductase n=1 Tax=Alteromonas pelagimontana TaxID=1858656 RepID=A0A6M4MGE4_9ALTE|nr:aldo/keto reductase [Alteromonas pelagimontana]QJR81675.1 aldo/keto reductase [Alteromonas pelagimontana]
MMNRRKFLETSLISSAAIGMGSIISTQALAASQSPVLSQSSTTAAGSWQPGYRFGQGGAPLGGSSGLPVSDADAQAILENAWNAGMRYYDTSPWYGLGLSERRFGMALHRRPRDEYILSTKVGRILSAAPSAPDTDWANPDSFDYKYDYSASATRRSIEDSLQRLGVSSIDLVFIHDLSPDNKDISDRYDSLLQQAIKGAMPELTKMREEGMIKGWGMGVNTLPPILAANENAEPNVHLAACQYTLMDHRESLDKLFPSCKKANATVVVGSPLNNGFLAGKDRYNYSGKIPDGFKEKRARMNKIAAAHGTDLRTAALQFCSAPAQVSSVIPGARKPHQPEENVASMRTKISADFWAEMKAEGLIEQNAPEPQLS